MQRQVWRENHTDKLFIVDVERYDVIAAAGPIERSQIDDLMKKGFQPDPHLTNRLAADYSDFRRYEW